MDHVRRHVSVHESGCGIAPDRVDRVGFRRALLAPAGAPALPVPNLAFLRPEDHA